MKNVTIEQRTYTTYVQFEGLRDRGKSAIFYDGCHHFKFTINKSIKDILKSCPKDCLLHLRVAETCYLSQVAKYINMIPTHLKRKAVVDEIIRIAPWKEFAAEM